MQQTKFRLRKKNHCVPLLQQISSIVKNQIQQFLHATRSILNFTEQTTTNISDLEVQRCLTQLLDQAEVINHTINECHAIHGCGVNWEGLTAGDIKKKGIVCKNKAPSTKNKCVPSLQNISSIVNNQCQKFVNAIRSTLNFTEQTITNISYDVRCAKNQCMCVYQESAWRVTRLTK